MRLLLAEDEKALADALGAALKHNNYSVDIVYNGKEAVDYLAAGNYDALLKRYAARATPYPCCCSPQRARSKTG